MRVGCLEHSLVSADRSHGRKRIHALCARGTWHQFNGKRGDTRMCNILYNFFGPKWPQKSNENLIAMVKGHIIFTSNVVRPIAEHLHDDVGRRKYGRAVGYDL